jgi:hypothetical protein
MTAKAEDRWQRSEPQRSEPQRPEKKEAVGGFSSGKGLFVNGYGLLKPRKKALSSRE